MKNLSIRLIDASEVYLLLAKKGENVIQFAERSGISFSHVYKILKEEHQPTPRMAYKFSNALGVPVEKIFYFEKK